MKRIIKFIYWLMMSLIFILLVWKDKKINNLNHIELH